MGTMTFVDAADFCARPLFAIVTCASIIYYIQCMNGLMLSICIYMYIEKTSNEFLSAKKDMLMLSGRPNQLSATGCTAAKRLHCDGDARELGCYLEMCNKQTLNSSRCRSGAQKP